MDRAVGLKCAYPLVRRFESRRWQFFLEKTPKRAQQMHWIAFHGPCTVLVSESAPTYQSDQFAQWCEARGIKHLFIAPYRHESLGLVERCNRTIIQ